MDDVLMKVSLIRIRKSIRQRRFDEKTDKNDGGPGSGNWGHAGRPGERGGSAEGGGVHNRFTEKNGMFSSNAKRAALGKEHDMTDKDIDLLKEPEAGTKVFVLKKNPDSKANIDPKGETFTWSEEHKAFIAEDNSVYEPEKGDRVRVFVPAKDLKGESEKKTPTHEELKERFDNAYVTNDSNEAQDRFIKSAGDIWKTCNNDEKIALHNYTDEYFIPINEALREGYSDEDWDKTIKDMTGVLDRCSLQEDTILSRGINVRDAATMFNVPQNLLEDPDYDGKDLIGVTGTDDGFGSCGTSIGTGFTYKKVQLRILAPKGTKALYAEPWSANGNGQGKYWDGESKVDYPSEENETILQRGTTYQIMGVERKGFGKIVFKVAIVNQSYDNSEYNKAIKKKSE